YNYRLTGKPWSMPYMVNDSIYAASPRFWFLPASSPIPSYHHEVIRKLWVEWDRDFYLQARANPFRMVLPTLGTIIFFFFPLPIRLSLLIGIVLARSRKAGIAVAIIGAVALGLLIEKSVLPHYYAPA